ncbi:MAG: DNA polymerase III subunit gamma/tau [Oscillospiraceae bacterium]|jgi:DNA polymerase III subunit gamma/tau
MYQVLYRKWRPKTFSDVVGQTQVTRTLKNELTSGRIAHAYLFTGSRGTGKTTCAKILAKAVNCLNPNDGDPCGKCEICRGIDEGSVMDIVEIDAASNNGVDSIRTLREEATFTPAAAKYRVYIIDEVHMLSVGAFNALLKTLEEPPPHVIFILATTEVHKLPATILSRCQRFDFNRIPPQDIAARLSFVAEQEGASIDPQAALLIARLADGALRDALSILDQCFGRSKNVTEDVVVETAGLVGREHLFRLADAVRSQDSASALEMIDQLHSSSKDMARLCEELSSHFRSLMLIKTMKNPRSLLAVTDSEYEELTKQARAISMSTVLHAIDALQATLEKMFRGGDRRIEFELAMMRLCSPQLDSSPQALVRRIEALEQGIPAAKTPMSSKNGANTAHSHSNSSSREQKSNTLGSGTQTGPGGVKKDGVTPAEPEQMLGQLRTNAEKLAQWPEIVERLKNYSHTVAAAFNGSTAYVSGDYVLIDAPNEIAFRLLRRPEQRENMRRAIQQVTGKTYNLGPYRKPKQESPEEDALVQLAQKAASEGIPVETK